ncbi:unnamed protein product [Lupinus luteus]|uniref:Reverse transcriptase zinc-binding domain-containing protein n=1 Tax=Lupinus luteus TaxID=3873 RepID=A0AAV1VRN8_LUPLU
MFRRGEMDQTHRKIVQRGVVKCNYVRGDRQSFNTQECSDIAVSSKKILSGGDWKRALLGGQKDKNMEMVGASASKIEDCGSPIVGSCGHGVSSGHRDSSGSSMKRIREGEKVGVGEREQMVQRDAQCGFEPHYYAQQEQPGILEINQIGCDLIEDVDTSMIKGEGRLLLISGNEFENGKYIGGENGCVVIESDSHKEDFVPDFNDDDYLPGKRELCTHVVVTGIGASRKGKKKLIMINKKTTGQKKKVEKSGTHQKTMGSNKEGVENFKCQRNVEDTWMWASKSAKEFEVKEAYINQCGITREEPQVLLSFVWGKAISAKVSCFVWKMLRRRLPTKSKMLKRSIIVIPNPKVSLIPDDVGSYLVLRGLEELNGVGNRGSGLLGSGSVQGSFGGLSWLGSGRVLGLVGGLLGLDNLGGLLRVGGAELEGSRDRFRFVLGVSGELGGFVAGLWSGRERVGTGGGLEDQFGTWISVVLCL